MHVEKLHFWRGRALIRYVYALLPLQEGITADAHHIHYERRRKSYLASHSKPACVSVSQEDCTSITRSLEALHVCATTASFQVMH